MPNVRRKVAGVMTNEQVEKMAVRCALGNNGGEWATHYTGDQKEFWRKFVRDLEREIISTDNLIPYRMASAYAAMDKKHWG